MQYRSVVVLFGEQLFSVGFVGLCQTCVNVLLGC